MLFRIINMSGIYYALKLKDRIAIEDDIANMIEFANQAQVVYLTDDVDTFADELGIDIGAIQVIE